MLTYGEDSHTLGAYTNMQKPYLAFDISDTSATARMLTSSGKEITLKSTVQNGLKIYYTPLSIKGGRRELSLCITPESGKKEIRYTLPINPAASALNRPTNCHARQSGTAVNLNWAPVSGANFYRIYRADVKDKKLTHLTTIEADQCSYTDLNASLHLSNPKYKIVPGLDQYDRITTGPSSHAFAVPSYRPTPT